MSLKALRKANYPLYCYVVSYMERLMPSLMEAGIGLLQDDPFKRDMLNLSCYLSYYFGEVVNLSELRAHHRPVYNYLCNVGNAFDVVSSLGHKPVYNSLSMEEHLIKQLTNLANPMGEIKSLPKDLYDKLYYRAKRIDKGVRDYIQDLGFTFKEVSEEEIWNLIVQGKSVREIAQILGISKSTIHNIKKEGSP